jgi:tRNA 2-(methylsulfanyl)-N6-isopentenyladenosine37 hydroxylase
MDRALNSSLEEVLEFLPCKTPDEWVNLAPNNLPLLLIDHANCEKKAAATAMNLMYRHVGKPDLLICMARLAREELTHFQQVVGLLVEHNIVYERLSPSRYAMGLQDLISRDQDSALVDILIMGAFVEARSCERFSRLIPVLDARLASFYQVLLRSEARHFRDYLELAGKYSKTDIKESIARFSAREKELISSPDSQFRFHSGRPDTH